MKRWLFAPIATLAVFGSLFGATAARANATFDYTGTTFATGIVDGATAPLQDTAVYGSSLDATIMFDATVTSNFTGTATPSDVLSWSFSAGPGSLSSSTSGDVLDDADFSFVNGIITAWSFQAEHDSAGSTVDMYTDYVVSTASVTDASLIYTSSGPTGNLTNSNFSSNGVGTWAEVASGPIPEPASIALLGKGLLGFGAIRHRRS